MVLSALLVSSCKVKQPIETKITDTTNIATDTTIKEKEVVNQAIIDTFYLQLSQIYSSKKECDSLINYYRNEALKSFATAKNSGDNSYEIKYNEALKRLEFLIKVGQTSNKATEQNAQKTITKTVEKTIEVPVKLPLTWWQNLFYWIGISCCGIALAMIVFFALKSKFIK